jgi:hypothetical protein
VDHGIAEQHGGQTALDNLALSCTMCNRRKGSDIGSVDPELGIFGPLLHPRTQQWSDQFRLDGAHIAGLTGVGHTANSLLRDMRDLCRRVQANARRVRRSQAKLPSFILVSKLPSPP